MSVSDQSTRQDRDLVLPPGTFAYVLDTTKGNVSAYVGPRSGTLSPTDRLVVWTGKKFTQISDMAQAVQPFIKAAEGQYVVLSDPAETGEETFPKDESISPATALSAGRRIVIPGPTSFALWPGQSAQVIDGHRLNLNQYLVAQVYDPAAAKANIDRTVAASVEGGEDESDAVTAREFKLGQRLVIKGTDLSFYIPPTGIEVEPENPGQGKPKFVRDAASLEQLEYCVLQSESGGKRYEQGPKVVFPEPTETFVMEKGERKFRGIELNSTSGVYVKVIAEYEEDDDKHTKRKVGEELFLTGGEDKHGPPVPIYFPRREHTMVFYGEKRRHTAIAIPAGEGRYVLDRDTGKVELVKGPIMFLPDPRHQEVVRRVLDRKEVQVMYPGNEEAEKVNAAWQAEKSSLAGDFLTHSHNIMEPGHEPQAMYMSASSLSIPDAATGQPGPLARSHPIAAGAFAGDRVRRTQASHSESIRTITLDTKYQGVVTVSPWPGYAVMILDKAGKRRVEKGPQNILLAYDESLMALTLSTGRPKDDSRRLKTVYLRTLNNSVGDLVTVETRDFVPVTLELSLRINFEGATQEQMIHWFDVEDYVALLTDHCRSRLRNAVKRLDVQSFHSNAIDTVRDTLLGTVPAAKGDSPSTRTGLRFQENGMHLYDVEVLNIQINHPEIANLLSGSMTRALEGAIELTEAEETATRDKRLQEIERGRILETEKTAAAEAKAQLDAVTRDQTRREASAAALLAVTQAESEVEQERRAQERLAQEQVIALRESADEVDLKRLKAEVEHFIARTGAVSEDLIAAMQSFGDRALMVELSKALGPAALASGTTVVELLDRAIGGTPLGDITGALAQKPLARANGRSES